MADAFNILARRSVTNRPVPKKRKQVAATGFTGPFASKEFEALTSEEQKGFSPSGGARFNILATQQEQTAFAKKLKAPKPKPPVTSRPVARKRKPRGLAGETVQETRRRRTLLAGRTNPRLLGL